MSVQKAPKCDCRSAEHEQGDLGDSMVNSEQYCCSKQRNWAMFCDKNLCDVCFIVGCEPDLQRIYAHRIVLSTGSSVFKTMFSKEWSSKANEIEVTDIEPAVFSCLLRFIYMDDVELKADLVVKVLYAARKYAVLSLENKCLDFFKKQICPENAFSILTQAQLFDEPKLLESCFKVIDDYSEDVVMSDGFTNIDIALLRSLLERDTLAIYEIDLFKAVVRWSVAECERKNLAVNADSQKFVLDSAILLVRFPLMTLKEFASEVLPCNFLSYEEVVDMVQYFSDCPKPSFSFITTPRASKLLFVVNRFKSDYAPFRMSAPNDRIGFSFDKNVWLIGFGFFDLYAHEESEFRLNITVKNQETGDILYKNFAYKSGNCRKIFRIFLEKPVKLASDTNYAVIAEMKGRLDSWYGCKGQTSVDVEDHRCGRKVKVTFQNIDHSSHDRTDINEGQIPEILFHW